MMQKVPKTVPVPGVFAVIAAGFDLTARHLWLVLIPAVLDSFLWLGPRLSLRPLLEWMVSLWQQEAALAELSRQLLAIAPQTNLFTSLSLPFIGVPVLMAGIAPEKTPLSPAVVEINSLGLWFVLFVTFALVGLLLTAAYYHLIAQVVRRQRQNVKTPPSTSQFLRAVGLTWLQLLGLIVGFFFALFVIYLPLLPLSLILSVLSSGMASLILFAGPVLALWLILYLCFVPQGLTLNGRSLGQAVLESARLVQRNLMPVLTLLLAVILIGSSLDWLLAWADNGAWFTLVNILGHAFISTALVTATFIFYRDRIPEFRVRSKS